MTDTNHNINLTTDTSQVDQGTESIRSMGRETDTTSGRIETLGASLRTTSGRITLVTAGVGALVFALDSLSNRGLAAATAIDSLGKLASELDLTVESLQEMAIVANDVGVTQEELAGSFTSFKEKLGEARTGTGEALDYFNALNISFEDINGNVKDAPALFEETSRAISSLGDSTLQADAANRLLDGNGQKVIKMYEKTGEEVDTLIGQAYAYGAIMSSEMVSAAEQYKSELDLINKGTQQLALQRDMALAPLTQQWELMKNEIAFSTMNVLEFFGVIEVNSLTALRNLERSKLELTKLLEQREKGELGSGRNDASSLRIKRLEREIAKEQELYDKLRAEEKATRDIAATDRAAEEETRLAESLERRKQYIDELNKLRETGGSGESGSGDLDTERMLQAREVLFNQAQQMEINLVNDDMERKRRQMDETIRLKKEEIGHAMTLTSEYAEWEKQLRQSTAHELAEISIATYTESMRKIDEAARKAQAQEDKMESESQQVKLHYANEATSAIVGYYTATGEKSDELKERAIRNFHAMILEALVFEAISGFTNGAIGNVGGSLGTRTTSTAINTGTSTIAPTITARSAANQSVGVVVNINAPGGDPTKVAAAAEQGSLAGTEQALRNMMKEEIALSNRIGY